MTKYKLGEIIELNPRESIKKGNIARKIAMDDLGEFKRDIESYSYSEYKGGTKFRNYDTLMARITPCLENGKTSFVNILEENEVAFGSTEYFVFRAKQDIINPYYLYYLVTTDKFREVAIKSMSGTSGRQRVQKDQILDFSVDLPSLEDQEKIMKPLKLIDDKISLNTKLNTNLVA
ncbi:restriction endonuclease subunit S [Ligilactobacillus salivarius]|uniref:restriction endonuclease subunit S n=1 Tax=Ligilactobacillus salivarius TaxID=1624 RepID=UPI00195B3098|nr:restriction endonuclease subunit S [Ligilactobacillus salivarius]